MDMPADILTNAAAAVEVMPQRPPFKADVLTAIASAILAERKRCAEIADSRGAPGHFMNVRSAIRNAINSGEQP